MILVSWLSGHHGLIFGYEKCACAEQLWVQRSHRVGFVILFIWVFCGVRQCRCESGFRLKNDGKTCMDVDECTTTYPCSQRCVNSYGSFHCLCVEGYVVHTNDSTRCKSSSGMNRTKHTCTLTCIYYTHIASTNWCAWTLFLFCFVFRRGGFSAVC